MEGLIKGIIGVALGDDDNNNVNRNNPRGNGEEEEEAEFQEEQRSRGVTWAQVAASDSQNNEHQRKQPQHYYHQSQVEVSSEYGGGDWETVGHKKQNRPKLPQKIDDDDDDDITWQQVPVDSWHKYKTPASDQHYAQEVDHGTDVEPSHEELSDLSRACNKLWELDTNRLVPEKDYSIDCGGGKKTYQKEDMASGTLFGWLADDVFARPTFSRFCSLLDNYNPDQGCKEVVTSEEKQEQAAFVEEISRTAPVKYLHRYLVAKGIVSDGSCQQFKKVLTSLWFDLYGRGGSSASSSAFEHVFVGEIKNKREQEVSGFHNWIQFYLEEAKGRVDYQGYIFPRRRGQIPDSETQLLTIQFEWNGVLKSLSSTLIGVSPEFEIALYTLCFFVGEEDNRVCLGPYPVNVKCHRLGPNKIGSLYPVAEC